MSNDTPRSRAHLGARLQRFRAARILSRLSALALLAPVVGVHGTGVLLPASSSLDTAVAIYVYGALAAAVLAVVAILLAAPRLRRRGTVHWDAHTLALDGVEGAVYFPREEIEGGLIVTDADGPAVELTLRGDRVMRLSMADRTQATALVDGLGLGASGRRMVQARSSPSRPLLAGCATYPLAFLVLFSFAGIFERAFGAATVTIITLLVVATTLFTRRLARGAQVIVGAEGVVLVEPFRGRRSVPFSAIERVESEGRMLVLTLAGSEPALSVRLSGPPLAEALRDRIHEAAARARSRDRSRPVSELLDPGDREVTAWREDLARLLAPEDPYRRANLDVEQVAGVLDDPSAPPRLRVGAALALRESGAPEAKARVRVAAEACADDPLREALEAAAAEEIDDEVIRRAVLSASAK